jgi:hypothetical protein
MLSIAIRYGFALGQRNRLGSATAKIADGDRAR